MLKILAVFLVAAAPVFAQSSPSDAGDAGSSSVQIGPQGQGVAIPGQNLDMGQNLGGSLEQSAIELPPVTPGVQTRIPAQVQIAPTSRAAAPPSAAVQAQMPASERAAPAAPQAEAVRPESSIPAQAVPSAASEGRASANLPARAARATAAKGGPSAARSAAPVEAESGLNQAASQISAAQAAGAGPGAVLGVLNRVFEAEKAGQSGIGGTGSSLAQGREADAKESIAYLVSQAASVAPEQAPALYEAAVAKTQESASPAENLLRPSAARTLAAAILKNAVSRAKTALPQLAEEAYKAAAQSPDKGRAALEKILGVGGSGESDWAQQPQNGALDQWQALLKKAGRPIENLDELKSDVKRVQDEAAVAASSSKSSPATPRVAFILGRRSFNARLPLSRVPQDAFASFSDRPALLAAMPSLPEPIAIDQGKNYSSPSQAAAYLRRHGAGMIEVARFYVGYFTVWLRYEIFRIESFFFGPAIPARAPAAQDASIFFRMNARYGKAMASLPRAGAPMTVAEAQAFLAEVNELADGYERLSGDASAAFIMRDFTGKIDNQISGLSPMSPAPDFVRQLIEPESGDTLSHWAARFHAAAAEEVK